jgi:hypothetical protein
MPIEKPRLQRDWVGRYVRLKRDLQNGAGGVFPAGTVMRVDRYRGGMSLSRLQSCEACGSVGHAYIRKVFEGDVELLPADLKPEAVERLVASGISTDTLLAELNARGLLLSRPAEDLAAWQRAEQRRHNRPVQMVLAWTPILEMAPAEGG